MTTKFWWVRGALAVALFGTIGAGVAMTAPHRVEWSAPWVPRVEAVDQAIASHDASTAIRAWRDAYGAAVRSLRWDALADVGDAALRIERATGDASFRAEARRAYLHALFRARAARAVHGVHRVGAAFRDLGDTDMAAGAAEMASTMTAQQAGR
jgi:hypothetical protein